MMRSEIETGLRPNRFELRCSPALSPFGLSKALRTSYGRQGFWHKMLHSPSLR
jgi:hypothetical protein